jgi:tetratricopeptide (TPR) repeat protein
VVRRLNLRMNKFHLDNELVKSQALFQQGKHAKAKAILLNIIRQVPDHFEASRLLGYIAGAGADYRGALKYLSVATDVNPASIESWYYKGMALQKLGQHEKAVTCFREALRMHPVFFEGLHDIGLSLTQLGRFDESLANFDKALAINALSWESHFNRGIALGALTRYEEEIESYDKALSLNPGDSRIIANRGVALAELGRLQEAIAWLDKSLAVNPANAEALASRGSALSGLGRYDEAAESHNRALAIAPDYPEAHWNLSHIHLLCGDFDKGWKGYEWRWKTKRFRTALRKSAKPQWLGKQALQGKRILIYSEQGLGDTIQFCRYVELVAALGAEVILEVQAPLKTLLSGLKGVHRILARGETVPDFDFHSSLLSLPLAFESRLDTIPGRNSYITACPDLASKWSARMNNAGGRHIGIVWAGSATNTNDRNRSLPLEAFLPLTKVGLMPVSLQKDLKAADKAVLDKHPEILHFEEDITDFSDTAALIGSVDLVVTVDTSVAHLAGAMGKPVWILLPHEPDFRWLLNRDDSPWYPTARLFRQPAIGDWNTVIDDVTRELTSFGKVSSV